MSTSPALGEGRSLSSTSKSPPFALTTTHLYFFGRSVFVMMGYYATPQMLSSAVLER